MQKTCNLKDISTRDLCQELAAREAVQKMWIDPYVDFRIYAGQQQIDTQIQEGACTIFIVWD